MSNISAPGQLALASPLSGSEIVSVNAGPVSTGCTTQQIANIASANGGINPAVSAAGTNLDTATQLLAGVTLVNASDGTKGVKLPAVPTAGTKVTLLNSVAAEPIIVYPDAAATINAISSHGALTCANGVPVILIATSTTQWYTIPLLPS